MLAGHTRGSRLAFGVSLALVALLLTGCTAAPPGASGYTFDHVTAAIAPGFRGRGAFRCTGDVTLEIQGTGGTIAVSGPEIPAFVMDGGPLAYRGDRGTIAFRSDYGGLKWTASDIPLPLDCVS